MLFIGSMRFFFRYVDGYISFSFELMHMQHSPESIFEQTLVQLTNGACPTPLLILVSVSIRRNMVN
jgi:hypothetical protein